MPGSRPPSHETYVLVDGSTVVPVSACGWARVRAAMVSRTIPVRTAMGYGSDSAAAEQSDGYKLGSAFFVMTPFRYNVLWSLVGDGYR